MPILQRVSQETFFSRLVFKIIAELKVLHTQVSTVNQPKVTACVVVILIQG